MLNLLDQLRLTLEGDDVFVGPASHESHIRSFGGQIIAQSLMAVGLTVNDDRQCHSLHGYFLRPGNTEVPMAFNVDRVRDGRSFSMRRVDVTQNDRLMFTLMASFHREEHGSEHSMSMPPVEGPESLLTFPERFADFDDAHMARWYERLESFDVRFAGASAFDADAPIGNYSWMWVRFKEELSTPLLHRAVVSFISDLSILDPILLAHGRRWTDSAIMGASLDHSMWFHKDFDATQWLLFEQWSDVAGVGRGLAKARIWTESGELVGSVAQEALLRPPQSIKSVP